jgi:hypothetical protein
MNRGAAPIQVHRGTVSIAGSAADLSTLGRQFAAERHLRLPGFFAGDLLATIMRRLRDAPFEERIARRVCPPAVDLKLDDRDLAGLLHFVVNDRAVIDFVRDVTSSDGATGFVGAVYRLVPGMGHRDSWHSDVDGNRLVALTVNLSEGVFEGGELEMREQTRRPLWRIANTGPGDAVLFAIAPELQHRIRPIGGAVSKTAFAGWFCRDADLKL